MRTVIVLASLLFSACASKQFYYGIPEFPKFTETTEVKESFELTDNMKRNFGDLEIAISYQEQKVLDEYFNNLNLSSISSEKILLQPSSERSNESHLLHKRTSGIEKAVSIHNLVSESVFKQVRPYLAQLDETSISFGRISDFDFNKNSVAFSLLRDEAKNPYNLQDFVGDVRLDVFEISIFNSSGETKNIEISKVYLMDNLGNQQKPVEVKFFESIYLDSAPARFSNVQRTLLTSGPIFPNQTRRGFLSFYPIADEAETAQIFWTLSDDHKKPLKWEFKHSREMVKSTLLHVGIHANLADRFSTGSNSGVKELLAFTDPYSDVAKTGTGGGAGLTINTKLLAEGVRVCLIGAYNSRVKNSNEIVYVCYGETFLHFNSLAEIEKPIFLNIEVEKIPVEL
ncbi:hypothetical protein KJ564_01575 [bacterium]|nr:hypothetical protein [bacterium]